MSRSSWYHINFNTSNVLQGKCLDCKVSGLANCKISFKNMLIYIKFDAIISFSVTVILIVLPDHSPPLPWQGPYPRRWHSRRCWTGPGRAPWSREGGPQRRGRPCRGWGRLHHRSRRPWRETAKRYQVLGSKRKLAIILSENWSWQ